VDEGLLRSEQGRGVFVIAIPDSASPDAVAVALDKLREARRLLSEAEAALQA
jgi:DNA-binding GntR family transcriptional regulator